MKIKMITALTTATMCLSFGEVVDLEDSFAKELVEKNFAVLVEETKLPQKQKPVEVKRKRGTKKKLGE